MDQPGPTGMAGRQAANRRLSQAALSASALSLSASTSLSAQRTAHLPRPRTQAGPVILLADWEACAARRDGNDVAHPGGRFSLAGRA